MILYLDASALVKRYVAEPGTAEVFAVIAQADRSARDLSVALKSPRRSPKPCVRAG